MTTASGDMLVYRTLWTSELLCSGVDGSIRPHLDVVVRTCPPFKHHVHALFLPRVYVPPLLKIA